MIANLLTQNLVIRIIIEIRLIVQDGHFLFFLIIFFFYSNMKVVIVLGLVAFAISTVTSINLNEVIEEEWNLFKVCIIFTFYN